jgi:NADPH:quinone reductase-like Zn-dependent oxidoreductase
MNAAVITKQGQPVADNVQLVDDFPTPQLEPGHVLVRTEAAALNHLDLWVGKGVPGMKLDYPRISGSDACGVVEQVGEDVDTAWIGKRVVLNAAIPVMHHNHPDIAPVLTDIHMIGEHTNGCQAQYFAAPADNILHVPDSCDVIDAAAFGLTHLTAWRMLVSQAGLVPGHSVLITGIGGGVALACLNICNHLGCETIVTSRHPRKLEHARKLGADHAVLDEGDDWSKQVRAITHKRGVDICADSIGKAVHESCIKSLAHGGTFVTCGCTSGPVAQTNLARMFWLQQRIIGSTMGDMQEFRKVVAIFANGHMKPVIDRVHKAADVQAAYARLESGDQFGKVVVDWR